MEKHMVIEFGVKNGILEISDTFSHEKLIELKISGVDRDKLADVVGDIVRNHFFVWCD